MENYILSNAVLLADSRKIFGRSLIVHEGFITAIVDKVPGGVENFPRIDGRGLYASPGFVELHFHGCGERGLDDPGADVLSQTASFLAERGINTFVPTLQCNETVLSRLAAELEASPSLQKIIPGFYLEGPFINSEKKGGIQPALIRKPDIEYLKHLIGLSRGHLKLMTIAPELEGAHEIVSELNRQGIIPCYGHSNATMGDLPVHKKNKKYSITHLFNAMSGISHKEAGLAMAPFLDTSYYYELNADGVHVNRESVVMCARHCDRNKMVLITDSVVSAGLGQGTYSYYNKAVVSGDRGVRYADSDILIGSSCLIPEVVKRFIGVSGVPVEIAINAATRNPQELLGRSQAQGTLEVGKKADIVLFDGTFAVHRNLFAAK